MHTIWIQYINIYIMFRTNVAMFVTNRKTRVNEDNVRSCPQLSRTDLSASRSVNKC